MSAPSAIGESAAPARRLLAILRMRTYRRLAAGVAAVYLILRLSQRDLGQIAGLSRETVNRVLRDLRDRRLVERDRRSIRLCQPGALRTLR